MIAARRDRRPRAVRRTLLIVGEGLAEEVFLRHLKRVYVERGHKTITVKNAKGKGGGHVLAYTAGQRKAADYDQVAALLDTDADWNDERRALAQRQRIHVFEATPCLEALLLDIAGKGPLRRPRPASAPFGSISATKPTRKGATRKPLPRRSWMPHDIVSSCSTGSFACWATDQRRHPGRRRHCIA